MNATKIVSGGATGGGLGAAVVYILGRFGITLTSEDGALIALGLVAAVAFIAHNGISGVGRILWHGSSAGDGPSPQPPPAAG